MKNGLINVIVKWTGLAKAWELFDGKKAYIAGVGLILAGAAQIAAQVAGVSDPAGLLEVAKALPEGAGLKLILEGLGILGIRHAQAKVAGNVETPKA